MSLSPRNRILIVEDDKVFAGKISRVLGRFGECIEVESTPDVFYYLNLDPQVILLDICLQGDPVYEPQEAGIRILQRIRELPPPDQHIPVIIVTGCSEPEVETQCRQLEVEDFFLKAEFSINSLRDAVKRALVRRKQELRKCQNIEFSAIILFLAANPWDTIRIGPDREFREIDQALRRAEFRDQFDIRLFGAVRPSDLEGYLRRYKPDIVHFSGHGNRSGNIILESKSGKRHPVPAEALSRLFTILKGKIKIRCVVLNACYSEQQAQAISEHVDCVIGMSNTIGDEAAISFATAFYEALGCGDDVKTAFDLGCNRINLEHLGEQDRPKLIALNSDPASIVFVRGD